jgi:hypothetical protein
VAAPVDSLAAVRVIRQYTVPAFYGTIRPSNDSTPVICRTQPGLTRYALVSTVSRFEHKHLHQVQTAIHCRFSPTHSTICVTRSSRARSQGISHNHFIGAVRLKRNLLQLNIFGAEQGQLIADSEQNGEAMSLRIDRDDSQDDCDYTIDIEEAAPCRVSLEHHADACDDRRTVTDLVAPRTRAPSSESCRSSV